MNASVAEILDLSKKLPREDQWKLLQQLLEWFQPESGDIIDDLNEDQKARLAKSINESEEGDVISHGQVMEEVTQWLSK